MIDYCFADPILYPALQEEARRMKKNPTEAEAVMWQLLRRKNLGVSFKRQYIIKQYIADFVCLSCKLVVEIDGGYHLDAEQKQEDEQRTAAINSMGFTVIRFTNEEVMVVPDTVVSKIKETIEILTNNTQHPLL
ncbi:MAG: endonuclease domain-containing protein [Bacteroidales bacterium]|nr:endonuclease domain-containing protein [Candidatus Colicola faecequi]